MGAEISCPNLLCKRLSCRKQMQIHREPCHLESCWNPQRPLMEVPWSTFLPSFNVLTNIMFSIGYPDCWQIWMPSGTRRKYPFLPIEQWHIVSRQMWSVV
jgi:hypothetical protein